MNEIQFLYGEQNNLPEESSGQLLFTTDTHRIYLDTETGRVLLYDNDFSNIGEWEEFGSSTKGAKLSKLDIGGLTLAPAFDPDIERYAISTTDDATVITATPEDKTAKITILYGDTPVINGSEVTFNDGLQWLTIKVDGRAESKEYKVLVAKNAGIPYTGTAINDLVCANGQIIAIGSNSFNIMRIGIGTNWVTEQLPEAPAYKFAYGDNKFIGIGVNSDKAIYSEDSKTWNSVQLPDSNIWTKPIRGKDKFITLGQNSTTVVYSADGEKWNTTTVPGSLIWQALAYGDDKYVAVAAGTQDAAYSANGITWEKTSMPGLGTKNSVAYGNGIFVALGSDMTGGGGAYSTDGKQWESFSTPEPAPTDIITYPSWSNMIFDGNQFIAMAGGADSIIYGKDALTWKTSQLPKARYWSKLGYDNGIYVMLGTRHSNSGAPPAAAYSVNGIDWVVCDYIEE